MTTTTTNSTRTTARTPTGRQWARRLMVLGPAAAALALATVPLPAQQAPPTLAPPTLAPPTLAPATPAPAAADPATPAPAAADPATPDPATPAAPSPAAAGPAVPLTQPLTQPFTQPFTPANRSPSVVVPRLSNRPPTTQISMNFKDAPVDAVLDQLSQDAGFIIVKEAPVDGRVTVISRQPVSPDEAVALLNTVLKGNGYTAVRMGPRTLRIVSRDKAKKGAIPVRFGNRPEDIPETDDLITQIIPVQSVDAVKLKTDLQPLVGSDADLASNGGSNSIIITDTSANIKRVVTIISSLDKKDALENTILVRQLRFADATAAAKLISDIFKTPDQQAQSNVPNAAAFFRGFGRGGGGGGGGFGGGGPGGGGGGGQAAAAEDKGRTGAILAEADTRTNTVVVTGPTDTLKVIEGVLTQLDANPAADTVVLLCTTSRTARPSTSRTTINTHVRVRDRVSGNASAEQDEPQLSNRVGSGSSSSGSSGSGAAAAAGSGAAAAAASGAARAGSGRRRRPRRPAGPTAAPGRTRRPTGPAAGAPTAGSPPP